MKGLEEVIKTISGSPQFRITETASEDAPIYTFYGQQEIENDLVGVELIKENTKTIRTMDNVSILDTNDVLFSLISGKATIVRDTHQGYLYTQNYVKLMPKDNVNKKYLVYILNESEYIKRQWRVGLQGSMVLKHTIAQLRELELPEFPSYEKQNLIGSIYFNQLHLQSLRYRVADAERKIILKRLEEVI